MAPGNGMKLSCFIALPASAQARQRQKYYADPTGHNKLFLVPVATKIRPVRDYYALVWNSLKFTFRKLPHGRASARFHLPGSIHCVSD